MAITAGMVKELREMTGAGMMDCKKALTEADGSMEKAVELLREKGLAASAKKAGRIASEGMVAVYLSDDNKIGAIVEVNSETDFVAKNQVFRDYVAAVAKQYNVPMYIAAPTSTIDMNTPTGDQIKIEQRKPEEVTEMWYKERMAPEGVKVFNPAFDVTDHELIAGIVTEFGIARPPYTESFKEIFAKKEAAQKNK